MLRLTSAKGKSNAQCHVIQKCPEESLILLVLEGAEHNGKIKQIVKEEFLRNLEIIYELKILIF